MNAATLARVTEQLREVFPEISYGVLEANVRTYAENLDVTELTEVQVIHLAVEIDRARADGFFNN